MAGVRDDARERREVLAPDAAAAARRGLRDRFRKESREERGLEDGDGSTVVDRGERADVRVRVREVRGDDAGENAPRVCRRFVGATERETFFEVPDESEDDGVVGEVPRERDACGDSGPAVPPMTFVELVDREDDREEFVGESCCSRWRAIFSLNDMAEFVGSCTSRCAAILSLNDSGFSSGSDDVDSSKAGFFCCSCWKRTKLSTKRGNKQKNSAIERKQYWSP